jgi:pentatricopeptide repeat protein
VDDAYYLLESRKAEGYAVPLPAVNVIIEACAEMGDLDRAFATWAELDQLSLQPDTGTYNALLHTCVQAREVASGRRLINRMQLDGVRADATTYAHHCGLLVMSRQGDAALGLLQTCSEAGVTPTPKMYITLINHLLRRRMFGQAQVYFRSVFG